MRTTPSVFGLAQDRQSDFTGRHGRQSRFRKRNEQAETHETRL